MKRYTGKQFVKQLEERGASELMQSILEFIKHPTPEEITKAHKRGASGVRRRHFIRAKYEDTGEALCVELDLAYTDVDAEPKILRVVEYDTEAQYELYRSMTAHETPGTIESN